MNAGSIWAIARNTVRQAIRVRVAFVILAFYLLLVPLLPFVLEGDGTLRGLLHVVLTYSLIMAGVLLGILTLALSTTTLWSEIREKQIYLIEARPVRRWEVLLGKLVGILLINAGLLVFMALATWGCVEYIVRRPRWTPRDRALAHQQVLTARRVISPEPPHLEAGIDEHYLKLEKEGKLPAGKTEGQLKKELRAEALKIINALPQRRGRVWRFHGLPTGLGQKDYLIVRFKFFSSQRWDDPVQTRWQVGKSGKPNSYLGYAAYKPNEVHEEEVPGDAVDPDDRVLEVHIWNADPRFLTMIFAEDAIQVLVPVGSFVGNLARGLALIFIEVLFLAVLGLFCSTFMGFPVSPIVALCLLAIIYLGGLMHAELEKERPLFGEESTRKLTLAQHATRWVTGGVRAVLPPLDRYAPSSLVSSGEQVSWLLLLEATGLVAVLRGGLLLLAGMWVFERRELAGAAR